MKKSVLSKIIVLTSSIFTLASCNETVKQEKDINILISSNVEGRISSSTYYERLTSYRNKLISQSNYVSLVDTGNFTYGSYLASVNNGEEVIGLMNEMEYDFAIFGNGDFAYGVDYLKNLTAKANFSFLGSNLTYLKDDNEDKLSNFKKYGLVNYGGVKVGYIGLLSPTFMYENGPRDYMDEDDKYAYEIVGDDVNYYYRKIQDIIGVLKGKGANYIVALSSLPTEGTSSVESVIRNTAYIDVLIDGNSDKEEANKLYQNAWGQDIPVISLGKNSSNFGKITMTRGGQLVTTLVSNYSKIDSTLSTYISNLKTKYGDQLNKTLTTSNHELDIYDEDGNRLVDREEIGLANLIADSFKNALNADIALINSGSIKGSLPEGRLTFDNFKRVLPYEEKVIVIEASGSQIVDALEFGAMLTKKSSSETNSPQNLGGSPRFMQVSGLKYSVDTSLISPIELENGFVKNIEGPRRVKDVQVLKDGVYTDIDLNATYKVATLDKIVNKEIYGFNMFTKEKNNDIENTADIIALLNYINDTLSSNLDDYTAPLGRITIL